LPGEGVGHPDCIETDIDDRRDSNTIALIEELRRMKLRQAHLKSKGEKKGEKKKEKKEGKKEFKEV